MDGREHRISTIDTCIENKWLVPLDGGALVKVDAAPLAPQAESLPEAPYDYDSGSLAQMGIFVGKGLTREQVEARLPYRSKEARERAGKPASADQKHVWETDWLNHPNGEKTCSVCGIEDVSSTFFRADFKMGNGKQLHHYRDHLGRVHSSFIELSCPAFSGINGNESLEMKERARRERAGTAEVAAYVQVLADRVALLEAENALLREANVGVMRQMIEEQVNARLLGTTAGSVLDPMEATPPAGVKNVVEVYHPDETPGPHSRPR